MPADPGKAAPEGQAAPEREQRRAPKIRERTASTTAKGPAWRECGRSLPPAGNLGQSQEPLAGHLHAGQEGFHADAAALVVSRKKLQVTAGSPHFVTCKTSALRYDQYSEALAKYQGCDK